MRTSTDTPSPADAQPTVEVTSLKAWQRWLQAHHTQTGSVWLVTWKVSVPERHVPMSELVDEALCWGWVDSLPRALDAQRSMRRMSPRRAGSAWSLVNKRRVEALMAAGRMQAAGLAVIERAKADGSWAALDEVETLAVPADLQAALDAHPPAADYFERFPRSSKRNILEWIAAARKPETRLARIQTTAEMAAQDLRANHARQPKGTGR
ncbi:MAG: hypothetical protein EKK53_01940 [Burkholderiales bacterium]|nr:MAG: hypothetical protein EKK53_01940 [Burkholderiales bacterium]